ncbi:hypothetical protein ACERII_20725 [Evansella sp. AB-rgal1]|uniref:hypothetical protein n=1 Tax=Evansella sp. AB-rgal1 TaxID=3242696 RepID=UPI00359E7867
MTLAVKPFGEGKKKVFLFNAFIFTLLSSISGAIFGLIISAIYFLISMLLSPIIKIFILTIFVILYILNQVKLISIPIAQIKWQIPTNWVNFTPYINMGIWGTILGAGIFTYTPYAIFHLKYMYLGFFHLPSFGLVLGLIYGFSRAFVSIWVAYQTYKNPKLHSIFIKSIWTRKVQFDYLHILALFILLLGLSFQILS